MLRILNFSFVMLLAYASLFHEAQANTTNIDVSTLKAGDSFKECESCPEMVVIPSGSFIMGDPEGRADEKPVRKIDVTQPFSMGLYEVTFAEWSKCVDDGVCQFMPDDLGWGKVSRPVMGVNADDIQQFLDWLNKKTGANYRLPTEVEWEYAARAGTQTQYWWGDNHEDGAATYCGSEWDAKRTVPVGSFPSNPFGLYDVHGNVWEMTSGCYKDDEQKTQCNRAIRGGSWQTYPLLLRSARRYMAKAEGRYSDVGFRIVRPLN